MTRVTNATQPSPSTVAAAGRLAAKQPQDVPIASHHFSRSVSDQLGRPGDLKIAWTGIGVTILLPRREPTLRMQTSAAYGIGNVFDHAIQCRIGIFLRNSALARPACTQPTWLEKWNGAEPHRS